MSLHVYVGQLAHCVAMKDGRAVRDVKRRLAKLNEVLTQAGLPEHHEPEDLNGNGCWSCRIVGARLQPLRRLAAHARERLINDEGDPDEFDEWPMPWLPLWGAGSGLEDPVFEDYYEDRAILFDHLMYHSDSAGYYVPIEFEEPLYPGGELFDELGGQVGSSQGLLSDCEELARMIHLPTDLKAESKCFRDATDSADKLGNGWWRYPLECEVCLELIAACRKSLEWGAVIVFHG